METKYVRVPFDVELAKEISNGSKEGRIVTRDGRNARVLCFDVKDALRHIIALVDCGDIERDYTYDNNGRYYERIENEKDLMLEVPEYMTFKDGDVLSNQEGNFIFIFNGKGEVKTSLYACLKNGYLSFGGSARRDDIEFYRHSTEEEKQKLIEELKASKEPKAKEYLKRFFGIEVKPECEFKAGQPVIGIDGRGEWRYDLFSHYNPKYQNGNYICSARSYSKCLPYNEQTAHLLGTTGNPE